jgi:hypothetical protein
MNKTYLGDSVYAEMENGMIKLTTENGEPGDPGNTIYLEWEVYGSLKRWADDEFERLTKGA